MENNNEIQQPEEQKPVEQVNIQDIDYAARYKEAEKELEKLKKANSDFYQQVKKYKSLEKEKTEQNGDFEKLLKSEKEEKEEILKKYNEDKQQWKSEKIDNQAIRLANEIAVNAESANLLSHFIKENLMKLADEDGNLGNDIIESVKKEVKNNKAYAPLVAGSKASGSGAPGAGSGTAGVKEMSMSEYSKLNPNDKLAFSRQVQSGKAKLI